MHPLFRSAFVCLMLGLGIMPTALAQSSEAPRQWGDWPKWGDQGDGTYRNPVLPGDYSDVDCIRVGSDYYAISSTFQFSPGMVILHSKDLVNWEILGHAIADITQVGPELHWARLNRYGKGVWAGAIAYHDKKFWIYFGAPDEGYFMTSAARPEGPWEPLHPVLPAPGWDDCVPFWDDDGQGYLVGTNFRDGYKIHLWKLTPDGRDLVKESDQIIHQSKGSEANKLYKINGWYYHLFSEVKAEGRVVMMERAKNIFGPYAESKQLNHAEKTTAMQPNQGGLVQTESGDWYFYTHHGTGAWEGRANSLLPVTWVDGWPIIGQVGADGIGSMVWSGKEPVQGTPIVTPQTSDEFQEASLPPQWEWNYQPNPEKWSLKERPGWLRLRAFKPLEPDQLLKAGNTLTQRSYRTRANEAILKLDLGGMADGQKAGLCHFAKDHSALGVSQEGGVRNLEYRISGRITPGPPITGNGLWLKSTWGLDGRSQYSYSLDGKTFTDFGEPYPLSWGSYRGDRIGIYCYNNKSDAGWTDVDFFRYKYAGPTPSQNETAAKKTTALRHRAEAELRGDILPFWRKHAPDPARGGFFGEISNDLAVKPDAPRGALLSARILWTYSAAYRRYRDPADLEMARRAFADLTSKFWDQEHGGLYWQISADGAPQNTSKVIYAQSFGIYALSEYARAADNADALERAKALYQLIESHAHDHQHGGYGETFTRDWQPLDPRRSPMGQPSPKSQNTHLHLLEAFTNLLRAWPDPDLRQNQRDLLDVMLTRVLDPQTHHLRLFLAEDWTPQSDQISFGHDIEAAWLLPEAAEAVGDPALIARTRAAAVQIAETTLAQGIDADGGVFEEAGPRGLTSARKEWWPQAEAVVGFLNAWQISGDARYLDAAGHTWNFIDQHLIDHARGEWFRAASREGVPDQSQPKVSFWKCPYHNGRACLQIVERLSATSSAQE